MPENAAQFPFAARRRAHLRRGVRGERAAARALTELGLDVLCRNYRTRRGEIDLVARDGTTLCFVEVKTRRRPFRGRPGEAVGRAKKRRIQRAAARYLRDIHRPPVVYRYDVVEVIMEGRRITEVFHWPGAFDETA